MRAASIGIGVALFLASAAAFAEEVVGRAAWPDGSPVLGATFITVAGDGTTQFAVTDARGEATFPNLSPGRYTQLLHEVATTGGVDFSEKGYSDCVKPNLLGGVCLWPESTRWLVGILADQKPRDLQGYVNGSAVQISSFEGRTSRCPRSRR